MDDGLFTNAEGEEVEQTLLVVREAFAYEIPPRTTAGYRAADWDVDKFIWRGRLRVMSRGDECRIVMEDDEPGGEVFAESIVDLERTAVEAVTDSSRYFALRVQDDQGHHAFVGLGFKERTDAFDLNVALQDHAKWVRRRNEPVASLANDGPAADYSLKDGQTIKVNIKTKSKRAERRAARQAAGGGGGGIAGISIAPPGTTGATGISLPPPGGAASPFGSSTATAASAQSVPVEDLLGFGGAFGGGGGGGATTTAATTTNAAAASGGSDGWSDFAGFGSAANTSNGASGGAAGGGGEANGGGGGWVTF